MKRTLSRTVLTCLLFLSTALLLARRADPPRTTAETSDYKATSRHEEVVAFCKSLAKESPLIRLGSLGHSHQGRDLPLLILADPPVATAEDAIRSKKLIVFAFANIHAGEVDGKEALLMLARDLALAKERPLLKDLILVFAPIFNADGNELLDKNRPRQAGPELVGTRANAQKLDLNRDYVKLESPEVRALVRFLNKWDPAVVIDCHTTNGSYHRYTLTYEGGNCPAGDDRVIRLVRDEMLPDVTRRMEKSSGFRSFFYGNFSADRSRWETVPPLPRYGTHYFGLRNRISILSESYSLASFKDRVGASKAFVQTICEYTAEHGKKLQKLLAEARAATIKAGQNPGEKDVIVLRQKPAVLGRPVNFLGFVEETRDGRRVSTGKPKTYEVQYMGASTPTLTVRRPYAYLFPARLVGIVENLQRHGITVEELREDVELDVEAYHIDRITRATPFQKHALVSVDASARKESRRVPAGTIVVRTGQALGNLAAYLLEPQSADGLTTWNFFDPVLEEKKDFPVLRLLAKQALHTANVRPLPEERTMNKPITFDTLYAGRPPNFRGTPVDGLTWLDDGQHYLQWKEGQLHKVHALSGRSAPFFDPQKLPAGLARLPAMGGPSGPQVDRRVLAHESGAHGGALHARKRSLLLQPRRHRRGPLDAHAGDQGADLVQPRRQVRRLRPRQ